MSNHPSKTCWFALTALLLALGCRPLCRITVADPKAAKTAWFGPEARPEDSWWPTKWRRVGSYEGKTVHVDPVDVSVLASCEACGPVQDRLTALFGKTLESTIKAQSRSLRLASSRDSADYFAVIKIASFREVHTWVKHAPPLPGSDTYTFWFKLIEARTGKVVFAYASIGGEVKSEKDFRPDTRHLVSTLDRLDKNHN